MQHAPRCQLCNLEQEARLAAQRQPGTGRASRAWSDGSRKMTAPKVLSSARQSRSSDLSETRKLQLVFNSSDVEGKNTHRHWPSVECTSAAVLLADT